MGANIYTCVDSEMYNSFENVKEIYTCFPEKKLYFLKETQKW